MVGATVVRYSFGVGLFHSFPHAGLSRRSRTTRPNVGAERRSPGRLRRDRSALRRLLGGRRCGLRDIVADLRMGAITIDLGQRHCSERKLVVRSPSDGVVSEMNVTRSELDQADR